MSDGIACAAAIKRIGELFPDKNWILTRGMIRPEEPLYACGILNKDGSELGVGEGDDLASAITVAIDAALQSGRVLS